MRIEKRVYDVLIHSCSDAAYEIGGIIGAINGVIRRCVFDKQKPEYGIYRPNTKYLNHIISQWQKDSITFCGIFHSHYPSGDNLSKSDLEYIEIIMFALKDFCPILYFPIIIPNKKIVLHRATIINSKLVTETEDLTIID